VVVNFLSISLDMQELTQTHRVRFGPFEVDLILQLDFQTVFAQLA